MTKRYNYREFVSELVGKGFGSTEFGLLWEAYKENIITNIDLSNLELLKKTVGVTKITPTKFKTETKTPKKCAEGLVYNPQSKRCIQIGGAAYKKWVKLGVIIPASIQKVPISTSIFPLNKLPFDIVRKTMIQTKDLNLILSWCAVNKKFQKEVCNDDFWRLIAKDWYELTKKENDMTWKSLVRYHSTHQVRRIVLSEKGKVSIVMPEILKNKKIHQIVRLGSISTTPIMSMTKLIGIRDRAEFNIYAIIDYNLKPWYYDTHQNIFFSIPLPENEALVTDIWIYREIISYRNLYGDGNLALVTLSGKLLSGTYEWSSDGKLTFNISVCKTPLNFVGIKSMYSYFENFMGYKGVIIDRNGLPYNFNWHPADSKCPEIGLFANVISSNRLLGVINTNVQTIAKKDTAGYDIIITEQGEVWESNQLHYIPEEDTPGFKLIKTEFSKYIEYKEYHHIKIPAKIIKAARVYSFSVFLDINGNLWSMENQIITQARYDEIPIKLDISYSFKIKGVIKTKRIIIKDISTIDLIPYNFGLPRHFQDMILIIDSEGVLYKYNLKNTKLTKTGIKLPIDKNPRFDLRSSEFIYLDF